MDMPTVNARVASAVKNLLMPVALATLSGCPSVLLHRLHSVYGKFDIDVFHFCSFNHSRQNQIHLEVSGEQFGSVTPSHGRALLRQT
jgi:hypothetical protein